jgi:cell division ATPase FtsA
MNHGSISDLRSVSISLERAMVHASQKVENIPHDAILSFSSSTFLSDILTTQYTRSEKSKEITMDELDTIVKRIEKESFDRVKIKAKEQFGIVHDDMRLVSSTITAISIDGKNITNPIGFTG